MSSKVPSEWEKSTLGAVSTVKARIGWRGLSSDEYTSSGPFLIAGKHIREGVIDWSRCDHLSEFRYHQSPEIQLQNGDVILSKDGSIGNPALISGLPGPATINGTMMLVRAQRELLDPAYLYQVVRGNEFARMIREKVSGSSIPHIFQRDIVHFPVVLPPLDEQRRIAEVLHTVDEAIAANETVLASNKLLKRTCREAAVARSQHHAPSRLQSVLASIDAGWSPNCESEPANDGEWSILKTSAVVWEGYSDEENKRLPAHLEPRPHLEVVKDDILITRAGPAERTGVIAIVRETAGRRMLSDKIIRLRVDREKAVPLAISELLSSEHVQAELIRSKSGMAASQTNISQKIVLGLEMHLPPLSEQQVFAEEMAALQDAIEAGEADLQTTRELKAALMSDLLSGRVRVPA